MGVFDGSIMEKQVFWIDSKRCLRPMLAPHLYEYMREVGRLRPRPVRLFEASSALGPHPLDAAWGIMENWVGIGFGLERLTMAATGESTMAKTGRSLSYLHGIRLRI